jgi:predicted RND superfamily exporter protein
MQRFWRRLAALQTRRPASFLLIALLLAGAGAWRASKLRIVTDFADLLQQDAPSVVEIRRILARTRGLSNVFVVLEGSDPAQLKRAADALEPRLRAIGPPYVAIARSGVQEARRFLMPRAGLYMTEADLDDLEQRLIAQERSAYKHAIGADLGADDDGAAPPAPLSPDELQKRLRDKLGAAADYPDGYYLARTDTGWAQVVATKAAVANGDLPRARETLARVQAAVTATLSELGLASQVKAGYSGDLVTGMAEYDLVLRDVIDVGGVGIALVLGVLLLFFRTPRALIALGATIAIGCALTFGFTELAIGHLNVATAFLFSIVAGNGINFGIIWLGRFLEERRSGQPLEQAIATALDRTYPATLTAAGAAATAYAALGIGSFRGFQHFGVIGASGMALCWLATYGVMPAITTLLERSWLRRRARGDGERKQAVPFTHFEAPFVWIVRRWSGATLVITLAVGVGAAVVGGRYLARGALEYNVRKLRSDPDTTSEVYRVSHISSRILAAGGSAGMIVLTDEARDTPLVAAELRRVRDRAPANLRPFQDVHTLDDLVPPQQEQRLERLRKLARRLTRLYERAAIDDATWAKIAPLLPPADLTPFTAADLPFQLREPFIEKDGTVGRVLYIQATKGQSDADLQYLLRWADAFRSTRLPDGRVVNGSGYAVIFADLLVASLVDMPRSVLLSLALTTLAVALFFRQANAFAMVLASLLLALVWMIGTMAVAGVRLSFINFIALPITFGIGVDYPVNIYARYMQDRGRGILAAISGAGGPVILCSLTTSLGYLALLRAHNQAVRSLGAVAVLGEVACLAAALLFLPAAVTWWQRRRRRDGGSERGGTDAVVAI